MVAMTVESLVARAVGGDTEAFTELVTRYQGMAFAFAISITGDYHLAEDAVQQALVTAYRSLPSLRDASRFGGWLRGIVRYESLRIVRDRGRHPSQSLEAGDLTVLDDRARDPERAAEIASDLRDTLALMARLPERQRIVTQLYYFGDQSQAAVADFLGLSVDAVNNRLREARAILRREGAYIMSTPITNPPDFAETIGTVIANDGPTIDARITKESRPPLLSAVEIGDRERAIVAWIAQYLDDDAARLVRIDPDTGASSVVQGMAVRSNGEPTSFQASAETIAQLVPPHDPARTGTTPTIVSTGIKVVDCFCPLVAGGTVALIGAKNVGKLVLVEELAHRLAGSGPMTLLVFLKTPDELGVAHQLDVRTVRGVSVVMVPVADASPEALVPSLHAVETVITMSERLGADRLYPAIDPLASRTQAIADSPVIAHARQLLHDGRSVQAELLRAYLTQPFFVAEPFTGRTGVVVDGATAEADLTRIVGGHVNLEAADVMMGGSLADIAAATDR